MNNKKLIPLLLSSFFAASSAHAAIDLIAIGTVDGNYQDLSARTTGPLESGVPGNILGGVGSGLAYAGGNTFIALPDRGPNANPYNPLVDDTTSYINRFHTFNLSIAANPGYDPLVTGSLPYILSPALTATTLLSSPIPLTYAAGGAPALNIPGHNYFTGRSDNFEPTRNSTFSRHGRLDPEGVRVSNDGKFVFISDEYGPFVYQFNRNTGKRIKAFTLPSKFAVTNLRAVETGANGEIEVNKIANGGTGGRTTNKGMEGLAITPDGTTLVGVMQTELLQDTKKYIRIVTIDIATGVTHEYAYKLVTGSGISEILAISNTEFLVLERDGKGLGDNSAAVHKKLYKIDIAAATDVSGVASIGAATPLVNQTPNLFLDVVAALNAPAIGINANDIPAKIESVAFGPDITIGGVTKHTLFVANDNDFLATITDGNHPAGIANPNKFFVFTFDDADLPTLAPQVISPLARDLHDRG
ncbi:MAG: esterase-like activity of phytase family protein [Methylococcaceae bacterium]